MNIAAKILIIYLFRKYLMRETNPTIQECSNLSSLTQPEVMQALIDLKSESLCDEYNNITNQGIQYVSKIIPESTEDPAGSAYKAQLKLFPELLNERSDAERSKHLK
ncbi:MAG: hypothetical protein HC877_23315 [Thioploca sp.]|nr:hypothetical protein [Thioploca sp.]